MKANMNKLSEDINKVCTDWDISGAFLVVNEGKVVHNQIYGYADRENHIKTKDDSRYVMALESPFLVGLCAFILMDHKKLKLSDSLSSYIPEYKFADKITIHNILKSQTGIKDYYYDCIMIELEKDSALSQLDKKERRVIEKQAMLKQAGFDQVMALVGEAELLYEPGTVGLSSSKSNWVILAEVIRRITGMSIFSFLNKEVFAPLDMKKVQEGASADTVNYEVMQSEALVRIPLDTDIPDLFTVTKDDMEKFLLAMTAGKIISNKRWKEAFKYDEEGSGLIFEDANGFHCSSIDFLSGGLFFYFNQEMNLGFASLVNEEQKMKNVDNTWRYFRRDAREVIESAFTYPKNTKMRKLSEKNLWNALNITVEKDQLEFVMEAKESVAMALMYKSKQGYVLTEGTRVVGLLVLDMDKKKNHYNIDIIQIDKRFQGRGFGKIMLAWAIEKLKKEGAKELEIGVNRFNHAAKKIYLDAGFSPKSVYEEGMTLHMIL